MKLVKTTCVVLLLAIACENVGGYIPGATEVTEVISVVRIGVSLVEYIYQVFSTVLKDSGVSDVLSNVAENNDISKRLLAEYQVISKSLERLEKGYESIEKNIAKIQQKLPQTIRQELRLDRLDSHLSSIWSFYEVFNFYQDNKDKVERHTLEDFALNVIGHDGDSVRTTLQKLHNLIVPDQKVGGILEERGIVALLADGVMNDPFYTCGLGESPHRFIYNLYNVLALTEIKGYAMIQFSYMIMRLYEKGNFTLESENARKTFERRVEEKLIEASSVLPSMSREFRKCDPKNQVEGETFIKMTRLLQGHIENEVDMNDSGSCAGKCGDFSLAKSTSCYKNYFCSVQPPCEKGRLFDCQFYDADAYVCLSKDKDRQYDWIEYEDGTVLGNKGQCENEHKVDSWWRWIFWHCSYCLCKCDAPGPKSDRYWSLRPVTSNLTENQVITGIRFVKKKGVIHLEIEQAVAMEEGTVNETTRSWVAAQSFDPNHPDYREGKDYMMMTYEERAMDLDLVEAQPGHAITGVRLRKLGSHLNIEIKATPIIFSNGTLLSDLSVWIGNDNTPESSDPTQKRVKLDLEDSDVPTKFTGTTEVDSTHNQYIMFDASSARKDAMQTTIPFIDAQPVRPRNGAWLTGVGLYHKGQQGYGGYVGFVTQDYDFSRHLLPPRSTSGKALKLQLRYDFTPKK